MHNYGDKMGTIGTMRYLQNIVLRRSFHRFVAEGQVLNDLVAYFKKSGMKKTKKKKWICKRCGVVDYRRCRSQRVLAKIATVCNRVAARNISGECIDVSSYCELVNFVDMPNTFARKVLLIGLAKHADTFVHMLVEGNKAKKIIKILASS